MSRPRFSRPAGLFLAGLLLSGCSYTLLSVPPLETLESTPTVIGLGDASLRLEAQLTREPDPPNSQERGSVVSHLRLVRSDGRDIPNGLAIEALYLVYEGAIWSTRIMQRPESVGPVLEVEVTEGPSWPAGEPVEVIARVLPSTGNAFMIRAEDQVIQPAN